MKKLRSPFICPLGFFNNPADGFLGAGEEGESNPSAPLKTSISALSPN